MSRSTISCRTCFAARVQAGQRVRVPFGRGDQIVTGYVVEVARPAPATVRAVPTSPKGAGTSLKTLHSLVDTQPLLSPRMLSLTRWIADHYLCAWGQVLDCVIPAGVKKLSGTREAVFWTSIRTSSSRWTPTFPRSSAACWTYCGRLAHRCRPPNWSNGRNAGRGPSSRSANGAGSARFGSE